MKDAIGNELSVGDAVHIKIGNEWTPAQIVKIQNGGIAVTGVPKDKNSPVGVTPDQVVVTMGLAFSGNPGSPQAAVYKLVAPNATDLSNLSSLKM